MKLIQQIHMVKKLKEIYKKENEKYVTKIKIINDFFNVRI